MMTVLNMPENAKAPPAETQPEPWVDIRRAAEHLGFSRNMVAKMAERGEIPGVPYRSGKRTYWRFKLSLIDAARAALMSKPA